MRHFFLHTRVYFAVLLAIMAAAVWALVFSSRAVSRDSSPVRVTIASGSSAYQIGRILEQQKLIRSSFMFALTCRLSGASQSLKPGVYELKRSMSLPQVIERLRSGRQIELWVTVPEGFTAAQIADLLNEKQLADGQVFIQLAMREGYRFPSYPWIASGNLEGYLFPDTYLVPRAADAGAIIGQMLQNFERRVVGPHRGAIQESIRSRFGLDPQTRFADGMHKLLTAASLVEREARIASDRPLVAAVIWNRLQRNMRLEVDATVSYRPGESRENKSRTLYRDLEADSPYNTYRIQGLPPAPICNPGIASIEAVLNPAAVDYLYYVARKDGTHIFSRTYSEHLAAVKRARSGS